MKLLVLLSILFLSLDGTHAKMMTHKPCIRVKKISVHMGVEDLNKYLGNLNVDDFIDVKYCSGGWSIWTGYKDAYVIYKSLK
jgi:hypothetical protein